MSAPEALGCLSRRDRGIALVELMVALAIGLLLLAGMLQLMTSSRQAYRLNAAIADVNKQGRFAIDALTTQARGNRSLGCRSTRLEEVDETLYVHACALLQDPSQCSGGGGDHVINSATPIGFDNADYVEGGDWLDPLPGNTSAGAEAAVRTYWLRGDILVTWGIVGTGTFLEVGSGSEDVTTNPLQDDLAGSANLIDPNAALEGGRLALVTDCEGSDLFTITNTVAGPGETPVPPPTALLHGTTFGGDRVNTGATFSRYYNRIGTPTVPGARIRARAFPFDYRVFFVCCADTTDTDPDSPGLATRDAGASSCDDPDQSDRYRPALCRWDPVTEGGVSQFAPEIADMRITYDGRLDRDDADYSDDPETGLVTLFSDVTETVADASWVTANDYWGQAHAAHVEILVASAEPARTEAATPRPEATAVGDLGYGLAADRRYYQAFSTVIALRVNNPWDVSR